MSTSNTPILTVSIVNWNAGDLILRCIDSVFNTIKRYSFEVVVVDNNSSDGSIEKLKEPFPNLKIIHNKSNLGYARAHNQVLRSTESDYILLLNPDSILLENTVDNILDFMEAYKDVGIAGPKVISEDGTIHRTLVPFPSFKTELKRMLRSYVPFYGDALANLILIKSQQISEGLCPVFAHETIAGPFLLLRGKMLQEIGYLDEAFFLFSEENDLCMRARERGWKRVYFPNVLVVHLLGKCREKAPPGFSSYHFYRSRIIFYYKHYGALNGFVLRILCAFFFSIGIVTGLAKQARGIVTGKMNRFDLNKINGWHSMKAVFCNCQNKSL